MSNEIRVVLSIYDPKGFYCRHVGVALTSLFRNTRSRVHVTLLHDSTLTDENRARFRRTAERFDQSIEFIDAFDIATRKGWNPDEFAGRSTRGALYRLLIPELFDCEKVIYLDCDVVVDMDIAALWDVPLGDASLAAAPDYEAQPHRRGILHNRTRSWIMHYDTAGYFNSGVLLLNPTRIRQKYDLLSEAAHFYKRYRFCAEFRDQDFLNVTFRRDRQTLDSRFNCFEEERWVSGDAIIHMMGQRKPWFMPRCTPWDHLYWNTFAESEWRDQLVGAMLEISQNNPHAHYHSSDCIRYILNRRKKDFFTRNALTRGLKDFRLCLTELRYRMSGN